MYKSILGAGCIVLGTILSNNVNHPILSPIVFSVGILLVISLDLGLITRSVPSGKSLKDCLVTYSVNLFVACVLGLMLNDTGVYPQQLTGTFGGAIGTGIVIGLVSIVNKRNANYKVIITMVLMFTFVYLKLPHCVVYAFYFGALETVTWASALSLILVTLGNVVGGLIVRYSIEKLDKLNS
jgi:formate/nitrite transporter FocA (FNT family)